MSADTPRPDLEQSEIDKAFGRILMFIAERSDPPNQEYLDAHNAVDFLREELDRRAPASASPPEIGEVRKCLVCAQDRPWGIFSEATGETVCVQCRDRARYMPMPQEPEATEIDWRAAFDAHIARQAEDMQAAFRRGYERAQATYQREPAPRFTDSEREALGIRLLLTEAGQPLRRELVKVLETWSKPCQGPCEHAHCPLLHELGRILREHSREIPPAPRFTEAEREALTSLIEDSIPDCVRLHDPDEGECESCTRYEKARATLRAMLSPQGKGE